MIHKELIFFLQENGILFKSQEEAPGYDEQRDSYIALLPLTSDKCAMILISEFRGGNTYVGGL